jgi:hypothetical protein
VDVIIMTTERPNEPETGTARLEWIPAPWPIGDGSVEIPGYDIPVLPVSGIMNGVIFYMLRSEVQYRLARHRSKSPP